MFRTKEQTRLLTLQTSFPFIVCWLRKLNFLLDFTWLDASFNPGKIMVEGVWYRVVLAFSSVLSAFVTLGTAHLSSCILRYIFLNKSILLVFFISCGILFHALMILLLKKFLLTLVCLFFHSDIKGTCSTSCTVSSGPCQFKTCFFLQTSHAVHFQNTMCMSAWCLLSSNVWSPSSASRSQ